MREQTSAEHPPDARSSLRNEPVQARSTARLATLLDAAAAIIDEIGFERLTTAMVADRAGASIGTVYRYFPDRIALLQALGARNFDRVAGRLAAAARDQQHTDWFSAVNAALDVLTEAFRTEPGFRSLRFGDVIDLRPAPTERSHKSIVADQLLDELVARFALEDSAEVRDRFEMAGEVVDSLLARAFVRNARGDESYLAAARELVRFMLADRFGGAPAAT